MFIGVDGNEANVKNRVGSNQYAFELLKSIHKLDKAHQWLVYLRDRPLSDMPQEKENWSYRIIGPRKFWTRFRLPFDLFFHQPRPDLFFSPGHYSPWFLPMPLVVSIMDLGYLRFPKQFTKSIFFQLKYWSKASIKKATHLLAISQATKNDIIRYYQIDPGKVTVTYPGYDEKEFDPKKVKDEEIKKVREKYRINKNYILFLSTLKPNKNIEGLLEAFVILRKNPQIKKQKLQLVIAGRKGWLFESIFVKVKELNLKKEVVFTDFIPEEMVPALIKGARVFVFPSFWEGFGIPVLEAMALGTPVVVSSAGSLPEIVAQAGLVINPHKPEKIAGAMERILLSDQLFEELQTEGFKRVKKFNWEKCAQATIRVLNQVRLESN